MKKDKCTSIAFSQGVFYQILDGLKAEVYVTDIDTDEIVFMNQEMKDDFGLQNPEGSICWKVLQQGESGRCKFCPVDTLKQLDRDAVYQWEETNPVTQRIYRNYDCLMTWMDGRTVHLQQSMDVTELRSANTDELTRFMTRKYGKECLKEFLIRSEKEKQTATICLYDVNLLKNVNDTYGHAEGDCLIVAISEAFHHNLLDGEFGFRMSGDEFVIVFLCDKTEALDRIRQIQKEIQACQREYEVSFCFGLAEVSPQVSMGVEELIFLADKRMYEQKRQFHIDWNERLLEKGTETEASEAFVYDKERLYDALVQSTDDYIYVCNMKTGVFKYTKAMAEEFNLPGEVIENAATVWGGRVHPDDKAAFLEANQEITDKRATAHCVEYRALNRKGEWVWVRCRGHLELDAEGEPILFAGFITNLGKKNKIDNLTGLFNRLEFREQIEHLLQKNVLFSVMILGIDDLKHINDLYNRSFGDEVIRIASQKIQSLLPANVTVYRLDGDTFGLIGRETGREGMKILYRTISLNFENQQTYDGKKFYCTLSGGCVCCPEDARFYEDTIRYADYCLEYSKSHGKKQCTYFSQDIPDRRTHELKMKELLRESVEHHFKGFYLMYQPLVCAESGAIIGVEALARWRCEPYGEVSPMEFIPLLESTGLIVEAGKWILQTAIAAARKWIKADPDFVIDVNLSYIQLQDPAFYTTLCAVLEQAQFKPCNLVLELTESYFIEENQRIRYIFQKIRELGVRIAMDDFGTGYSTLGILKELPADIVKIDKTFIRNIESSEFDATLIRFVVALCHSVGIRVCLEGVESHEVYDAVAPMELDMIQGYLFDRPLTEQVFTEKYFTKVGKTV